MEVEKWKCVTYCCCGEDVGVVDFVVEFSYAIQCLLNFTQMLCFYVELYSYFYTYFSLWSFSSFSFHPFPSRGDHHLWNRENASIVYLPSPSIFFLWLSSFIYYIASHSFGGRTYSAFETFYSTARPVTTWHCEPSKSKARRKPPCSILAKISSPLENVYNIVQSLFSHTLQQ